MTNQLSLDLIKSDLRRAFTDAGIPKIYWPPQGDKITKPIAHHIERWMSNTTKGFKGIPDESHHFICANARSEIIPFLVGKGAVMQGKRVMAVDFDTYVDNSAEYSGSEVLCICSLPGKDALGFDPLNLVKALRTLTKFCAQGGVLITSSDVPLKQTILAHPEARKVVMYMTELEA